MHTANCKNLFCIPHGDLELHIEIHLLTMLLMIMLPPCSNTALWLAIALGCVLQSVFVSQCAYVLYVGIYVCLQILMPVLQYEEAGFT